MNYSHVPIRLHYAVTSGHGTVGVALFLTELRVPIGWILHVVSESVCARSLGKG